MIYIVEIPHQGKPSCWSSADEKELLNKLVSASESYSGDIYSKLSGADILGIYGCKTTSELRDSEELDDAEEVADLLDKHGLDTTFYKGIGDEAYQTQPLVKLDEYMAWLRSDLSACMVFNSDKDAEDALENASYWNGHQGRSARSALQREVEVWVD